MSLAPIVDSGTEVLMPGPYYPPYSSYVKFYDLAQQRAAGHEAEWMYS
jgi:aspartate/methionine/tyrosine aminotransferase